jgi:RimJ/RimL family protein N-acetyltransferase
MKIILETERLLLREFTPKDGFHFYHLNNDPDVVKYTGNSAFSSLEEANKFILNYNDYKLNGFGRWAVLLKDTNEFLGWCGLKFEEEKNEIDLGFRFYKKYWRKGYATESAIACVNYGFNKLKLKEIVGRAYLENKASISVLKKCGLIFVENFIYDNKNAVKYCIKNDSN